jgi:lysophospholipase L1-like esterase
VAKIMIIGDSITEGSQGDYTWRYWLWKHLNAHGGGVHFVGPRHGLDDLSEDGPNEDSMEYADADFENAHDSLWGQPYTAIMTAIEDHVREYQPDILLTLLGINDFAWYGETPFEVEQDLRIFIAEARRAKRDVKFAFGHVLPTVRAYTDPGFGAVVSEFNNRLDKTAAELSLDFSPIAVVPDDDGFDAAEHTWDGTHPNTHGELRIAAAFADTLCESFGLGAPYPRPLPDIPNVAKPVSLSREVTQLAARTGCGTGRRRVRPASAVRRARWIATSDSESRCAVASSSTTTEGAFSSRRARATRCFSPPDRRYPRSPATVSSPSGSEEIRSQIRAAWHASIISRSVASGRAYARLARIVS